MRLTTLLACATAARALALSRQAEISDRDSCPEPPKSLSPTSLVGPTHSCSWCASRIARAAPIPKDAKWQAVAFKNEASRPVNIVEVTLGGTEAEKGTPVPPGGQATFRCQIGTVWRAKAVDDGELLVEHRVGRVRLVPEPPADAEAHAFGVDDADEWRSAKPAAEELGFKIDSAPRTPRPKQADGSDDHRFARPFVNHAAVPLDLYFLDRKRGTETLQFRLGPYETRDVATYWGHAFVVRDPVSGRRVSQFEVPVVPIRDCGRDRAAAAAAAWPGEAVAVSANTTDGPNSASWLLAAELGQGSAM